MLCPKYYENFCWSFLFNFLFLEGPCVISLGFRLSAFKLASMSSTPGVDAPVSKEKWYMGSCELWIQWLIFSIASLKWKGKSWPARFQTDTWRRTVMLFLAKRYNKETDWKTFIGLKSDSFPNNSLEVAKKQLINK